MLLPCSMVNGAHFLSAWSTYEAIIAIWKILAPNIHCHLHKWICRLSLSLHSLLWTSILKHKRMNNNFPRQRWLTGGQNYWAFLWIPVDIVFVVHFSSNGQIFDEKLTASYHIIIVLHGKGTSELKKPQWWQGKQKITHATGVRVRRFWDPRFKTFSRLFPKQ